MRDQNTYRLQLSKELLKCTVVALGVVKYLLGKLLVHLIENTLNRREPTTKSPGLKHQFDFRYRQTA